MLIGCWENKWEALCPHQKLIWWVKNQASWIPSYFALLFEWWAHFVVHSLQDSSLRMGRSGTPTKDQYRSSWSSCWTCSTMWNLLFHENYRSSSGVTSVPAWRSRRWTWRSSGLTVMCCFLYFGQMNTSESRSTTEHLARFRQARFSVIRNRVKTYSTSSLNRGWRSNSLDNTSILWEYRLNNEKIITSFSFRGRIPGEKCTVGAVWKLRSTL